MRNKIVKLAIAFALGVVVGAVGTYFVFEYKKVHILIAESSAGTQYSEDKKIENGVDSISGAAIPIEELEKNEGSTEDVNNESVSSSEIISEKGSSKGQSSGASQGVSITVGAAEEQSK